MRRKIILIIISILILTLSILGITYAFMRPQVEEKEEKSNITINACAKIQLKDNGNSINLENTYPMDDEMGLKTKPYEFTITSTCEDYVGFNLYLTSLITNEIEDSNIHFAIASQEDTVLVSDILNKTTDGLKDFNTDELKELDLGIKGTHKNIYKVYSNNIPLKGESNYKLYLWVDKDASKETMGKSFKIGLSVKSYNREETYADTCDKSLASCEIIQQIYESNTLIYHDGICDYEGEENCDLEAGDFSYRFSGASDIVSNYVCLDSLDAGDCESDEDLYRIIGLFKNEQNQYEIKLIKAQGATTMELGDDKVEGGAYYGKYNYIESYYKGNNYKNLSIYYWNNSNGESSTNMWKYSNLNKVNLNNFYYNYLIKKIPYLEKHLVNYAYNVGGVVSYGNVKEVFYNELGAGKITKNDNNCYSESNTNFRICNEENDLIYSAKIGLMYMSDYMYGTLSKYWKTTGMNYSQDLIKESNWLYVGLYEWTISRMVNPNSARRVGFTGVADSMEINTHGAVRPVFYITSDAKIKEGEGSKEKPYRIIFE